MSFQAYLDTIEEKTGLTPRQLLGIAHEKGPAHAPARPSTRLGRVRRSASGPPGATGGVDGTCGGDRCGGAGGLPRVPSGP